MILIVISVLASNLFNIGNTEFRKWGMPAVLVELVALFILIVKYFFRMKQLIIYLEIPNDFMKKHKKKIAWDANNCFVILDGKEKNIKLSEADISTDQSSKYRVHFGDDLTGQILNTNLLEFKLKDEEGRNWRVTFDLYERTKMLELFSSPPREGQLQ